MHYSEFDEDRMIQVRASQWRALEDRCKELRENYRSLDEESDRIAEQSIARYRQICELENKVRELEGANKALKSLLDDYSAVKI